MKLKAGYKFFLGSVFVLLTACDPQPLDPNVAAANNSEASNTTEASSAFEILSNDNVDGTVASISVNSQGIVSNDSNGTLSNPIILNKDEDFQIIWNFSVEEQSQFSLELKDPSNPDTTGGGFFNFNTCISDGECTSSSTTCSYGTQFINNVESLGTLNCDFTHPDSGTPITNAPNLGNVIEKSINDLPFVFELRARLCVTECDVIRIAFVQIKI